MSNAVKQIAGMAALLAIGVTAASAHAQSRGAYSNYNAPGTGAHSGQYSGNGNNQSASRDGVDNRRQDANRMADGRGGQSFPDGRRDGRAGVGGQDNGRGDARRGGYGDRGYAGYGGRDGRGYPAGGYQGGYRGYGPGHGYGPGYGAGGYIGWARGGGYGGGAGFPLPAYRGWGVGYGYFVPPVVVIAPAYRGWGYRGY